MNNSSFLTVEEVAQNLKVTRQTVSKYIQNKDLNAVKINKSYRITTQDFENFLRSNSTVEEPLVTYLKKTKNCYLDYEDKSHEFEVIYSITNGVLNCIEKNHLDVGKLSARLAFYLTLRTDLTFFFHITKRNTCGLRLLAWHK